MINKDGMIDTLRITLTVKRVKNGCEQAIESK